MIAQTVIFRFTLPCALYCSTLSRRSSHEVYAVPVSERRSDANV
jgi:hypothetical protein